MSLFRWLRTKKLSSRFILDDASDLELGKITRRLLGVFKEGTTASMGQSAAALFLVGRSIEGNSTVTTINLFGATVRGKEVGDWTITVAKMPRSPSIIRITHIY